MWTPEAARRRLEMNGGEPLLPGFGHEIAEAQRARNQTRTSAAAARQKTVTGSMSAHFQIRTKSTARGSRPGVRQPSSVF